MAGPNRDSSYTTKSGLPYVPDHEFSPLSPMPPRMPPQAQHLGPLTGPARDSSSDAIQLFPESVAMSGTQSGQSRLTEKYDYMDAVESSTLPPGATNPFKSASRGNEQADSTYSGVDENEGRRQTPKFAKATDSWFPPAEWVKHSPGGTTELQAVEEDPFEDVSAVLGEELDARLEEEQDAQLVTGAPPNGITSGYFAPQTGESKNFDPPTANMSSYSDPQTGRTPGGPLTTARTPYTEIETGDPTYMTEPYTERTLPPRSGTQSYIPPIPKMPEEFRRPSSRALPASAGNAPFDPTTAGGETRWTSSSWAGPTAGISPRNPKTDKPWYSGDYTMTGTAAPRTGYTDDQMSPGRERPQTAMHEAFMTPIGGNLTPIEETPRDAERQLPSKLAPGRMYAHMSRAPSLVQADSKSRSATSPSKSSTPSNGIMLWWRGSGLYVNAVLTMVAAILLNMSVRLTSSPLSVMMYAPPSVFGASAASTLETSIHLGIEGWCSDGTGNATVARCRAYVGMDFETIDGTVSIPENTLLTIADTCMNVLSALSCLLALYTLTAAILQVLVLRVTDLELSFLASSLRADEIEQEITLRCRQRQVEAQFWAWWAHTRCPLGPVFVLTSVISCLVAFPCMLILKFHVAKSTIGIASVVPAIAAVLYAPLTVHAVAFVLHAPSAWQRFSAGPSEGVITSAEIFSNEKMGSSSQLPPIHMAGAAKQSNKKSAKRRSKKHRWSHMQGGRRPSSDSSFATMHPREVDDNGFDNSPMPGYTPSWQNDLLTPDVTPFTGTAFTPGSVRPSVRDSGRIREPLASFRASSNGSQAAHSVTSEVGDPDEVERWHKGYQESRSLLPIIRDLRAGDQVEPYLLSDDGLLYIYVEDDSSDMDIAKLVPPDGEIRGEVLEEAYRDVLAANPASLQGGEALELVMIQLETRYWWSTMGEDVAKWLGL